MTIRFICCHFSYIMQTYCLDHILCNFFIIVSISTQIDIEWSGSNINFGQDAWDDSTILDIFDNAIKSHRTKKDKVSNTLKRNFFIAYYIYFYLFHSHCIF
jgi:hypothetical protein